eukprot:1158792-Pelagomonas_calceolata.AAC.2
MRKDGLPHQATLSAPTQIDRERMPFQAVVPSKLDAAHITILGKNRAPIHLIPFDDHHWTNHTALNATQSHILLQHYAEVTYACHCVLILPCSWMFIGDCPIQKSLLPRAVILTVLRFARASGVEASSRVTLALGSPSLPPSSQSSYTNTACKKHHQ